MKLSVKAKKSYLLRLAIAGACAGVMAVATSTVSAGECPADKPVADGQGYLPRLISPARCWCTTPSPAPSRCSRCRLPWIHLSRPGPCICTIPRCCRVL